jgi:hypothetical protein
MEPTFKVLLGKKPIKNTFRVSNIVRINEFEAIIEMGDRKIVFRAATGEQGEKGPFTFVELQEEDSAVQGFCITQETQFDDLWALLEAGCR